MGHAARDRRRRHGGASVRAELEQARAHDRGRGRARGVARRAGDVGRRDARTCHEWDLPRRRSGNTALGGPRAPRGASAALGRPPGGVAGAFAQAPPGGAGSGGGTPPQVGPGLLAPGAGAAAGRGARFGAGGPGAGGFGANGASIELAASYTQAHGGGTIGVASQSSAVTAIISSHANVAGLGGFSGRESDVSVSWLAQEVRSGHLRWVITESGGGPPGDARAGSRSAFRAVERACHAVTLKGSGSRSTTIYDCAGDSAALLQAASTRENERVPSGAPRSS